MIPLLVLTKSKKKLNDFLKKEYGSTEHYIVSMQPIKSEYSIDQIRELSKELIVQQPYKRIYVLEDFDHSSSEAQNAFLKLLEEPPSNVQFILVVSQAYSLLPTILSRTKTIVLDTAHPLVNNRELFALIRGTRPCDMIALLARKELQCTTRENAEEIIVAFIEFFRNRRHDIQTSAILKELIRSFRLIRNNNANPQLSVDHLLIFISKQYSIK